MSDMPDVSRVDRSAIRTPDEFAHALTRMRLRSGLSIRDVTRLVGRRSSISVSPSTVGGWFSGSHLPTPKLVAGGVFTEVLRACGVRDEAAVQGWLDILEAVRCRPG